MRNEVVNILTPTYNNGHLIHRLLNSVLKQTYPYIEMIVMDDGSTDNTKEIIQKYQALFKQKGYELIYHYQANSGLSATINNGLKYVTGDYLAWPDADDWYKSNDAIERMVDALHDAPESVGLCRCNYEFIDENTFNVLKTGNFPQVDSSESILRDFIFKRNDFVVCGWLIKVCLLDKLIPNREIYVTKYGGQNVQILVPYLSCSGVITIHDVLFSYLVRETSHSRNLFTSYEEKVQRTQDYANTYIYVLQHLPSESHISDIQSLIKAIKCRFGIQVLKLEESNKKTVNYIKQYITLLHNGYRFSRKQQIRSVLYVIFTIKGYQTIINWFRK